MQILAGPAQACDDRPLPVFAADVQAFLADWSRDLLGQPGVRDLPDVVTFAYWCRKAHLAQMAQRFSAEPAAQGPSELRVGVGLVFHIAPANVPVNFAFSLAFGLLAGNANVVRLPTRVTPAADALVAGLDRVLRSGRHPEMADRIVLTRFERDDTVNRFWLANADGRVVWGGDATVQHMRSLPCKPRSREVAFTDRYSLCSLAADAVLALDAADLDRLVAQLFNDIYLMDQAACSSPQLLVWVGAPDRVQAAQALLWPVLTRYAQARYRPAPVQVMDKYVEACRAVLNNPELERITQQDNVLYRVTLNHLSPQQDSCRGYFGTVHEVALESLDPLATIVTERYQTLVYFGFDPAELRRFILSKNLRGIDRVVPVGRALDMGYLWDGYDIIGSLSRLILIQ